MREVRERKPYTRTLEDELDWKLLDQLYGVVAQMSNFCFEIKKFCVTTEFVVLAFIAKFTREKLDRSIFVAALLIPLLFCFLDATAYFYQVKLRGTMEAIRERLAKREAPALVDALGVGVIAPERTRGSVKERALGSLFNHSMWLYAILIAMDAIAWCLFEFGLIR